MRPDIPEPKALEDYRGNGEFVLVVDDVKDQREVATGTLEQLGYRTRAAGSREEAGPYLEKYSADLILLDMIMDPGVDGLETYKRVN